MIKTGCHYEDGFSLVELIIAVLLVGIVAVAVFTRIMGPSAFDAAIARDNAIGMALQAQQASLGRENVTLEIDPAGDDWLFAVTVSGTVLRSVTIPGGSIALETGVSGTCALALDTAVTGNFQVTYDGNGNASGFTNSLSAPEPIGNGVRLCVNDNVEYSMCISPGGFAYQGDCDD